MDTGLDPGRPSGPFDSVSPTLTREGADQGYILHWNGEKKPWKSDGLYKQFWAPYALPLPAPRNALLLGNCLVTGGGGE